MCIYRDLLRLHLRVRVTQALGEPLQQVRFARWCLLSADVKRHIDVVERLERCSLGQTARQEGLDQAVLRMLSRERVELLAKSTNLLAVLRGIVALEVHGRVRESGEMAMRDLRSRERCIRRQCVQNAHMASLSSLVSCLPLRGAGRTIRSAGW